MLAAQAVNNSRNGNGTQGAWRNVCPTAASGHVAWLAAGTSNRLQLWVPADARFLLHRNCFFYAMRLQYNKATNTFSNNTGARVSAKSGGSSGMDYLIWDIAGYNKLAAFISTAFPGYAAGKNLFALPYDWRLDITAMDTTREMDRLAARISAAVAANCGKKAVLIAHSMGTLVTLGLLQNPRFQAWRQQNVKGFVALAPPFAGSALTVAQRVAGAERSQKNDWLDMLMGASPTLDIKWAAARGMPSSVMLLPTTPAFPADMVVATTPQRSYTVAQLPELLAATGDQQLVGMYSSVHTLDTLLAKGPIPGVDTFCIYGAKVNTTLAWSYGTVVANTRTKTGSPIAVGKGDGTVNLRSLRECNRVTSADRVTELGGDINHGTVVTDPAAHAEVGRALQQLLAQ
ncbi:hypothetical protein OEZ86_004776 [Tetradesmus obliquus]|nr:hypothetical protein OEZ86_004776 [Tetradesmus obliquus]